MIPLDFCSVPAGASAEGALEGSGGEGDASLTLQAVVAVVVAGDRAPSAELHEQINAKRASCKVAKQDWLDGADFRWPQQAGQDARRVPPLLERGEDKPCEKGQLTALGLQQAAAVGKLLRSQYAAHSRLALAVQPDSGSRAGRLIHVVTENTNSSRASAVGLLGGLGYNFRPHVDPRKVDEAQHGKDGGPAAEDQSGTDESSDTGDSSSSEVAADSEEPAMRGSESDQQTPEQAHRRLRRTKRRVQSSKDGSAAPPIYVMTDLVPSMHLRVPVNSSTEFPRRLASCPRVGTLKSKQHQAFPFPEPVAIPGPSEGGQWSGASSALKRDRDNQAVASADEADRVRIQVQRTYTIFGILFGSQVKNMHPRDLAGAVLPRSCASELLPCGPNRCAIISDIDGLNSMYDMYEGEMAAGRDGGQRGSELRTYQMTNEMAAYFDRVADVEKESNVLASARAGLQAEEELDAAWALRPPSDDPDPVPRLLLVSSEAKLVRQLLASFGVSVARNATASYQSVPYASRLVLELWTSPSVSDGEDMEGQEVYIRILFNGREVTREIDACANQRSEELCPLSQFKSMYGKWLGSAKTFDEVCNSAPAGKAREKIDQASDLLMDTMGG